MHHQPPPPRACGFFSGPPPPPGRMDVPPPPMPGGQIPPGPAGPFSRPPPPLHGPGPQGFSPSQGPPMIPPPGFSGPAPPPFAPPPLSGPPPPNWNHGPPRPPSCGPPPPHHPFGPSVPPPSGPMVPRGQNGAQPPHRWPFAGPVGPPPNHTGNFRMRPPPPGPLTNSGPPGNFQPSHPGQEGHGHGHHHPDQRQSFPQFRDHDHSHFKDQDPQKRYHSSGPHRTDPREKDRSIENSDGHASRSWVDDNIKRDRSRHRHGHIDERQYHQMDRSREREGKDESMHDRRSYSTGCPRNHDRLQTKQQGSSQSKQRDSSLSGQSRDERHDWRNDSERARCREDARNSRGRSSERIRVSKVISSSYDAKEERDPYREKERTRDRISEGTRDRKSERDSSSESIKEQRDRYNDRNRNADRERDKYVTRENDRGRARDTKDRSKDREHESIGDRDREMRRNKESHRERSNERSSSSYREICRGRSQDRDWRDRNRAEKDRNRNKDGARNREEDQHKDRERDRERESTRVRDRSPLRRDGSLPRRHRNELVERPSEKGERSFERDQRSSVREERSSVREERLRRDERHHEDEKMSHSKSTVERESRSSVGRESSVAKDESKKPTGYDPSKPSERWNDLERKLREEAECEKPDIDLELLYDEQDDSAGVDDMWVQCSPRENFLSIMPADQISGSSVAATDKLKDLLSRFQKDIVERGPRARASQPQPEQRKCELHYHCHSDEHSDSESSFSDSDGESTGEEDSTYNYRITCLENRANHPWRLAENLWFNEPGEMNDGPLCKCSIKQQKTGIRHNIYPGEMGIPPCEPHTNNATRLHHYRLTISPAVNFLTSTQTVIVYDNKEYIFEGFSLFSHHSLDDVPECKVVRFGIEYTLHFFPEPMPEHFTVKGLDLFATFLFEEILELWDFDFKGKENGCHHFHFMPRFARLLKNNGKEVLSMHHVIQYLIRSSKLIIDEAKLDDWLAVSEPTWQHYVDRLRETIATRPGKKPSSVRIDQVDRDQREPGKVTFPVIVHFGARPAQLSYIRDPKYRKMLKSFTRLRHLLLNKPRVTRADKMKLVEKEVALQKMRYQNDKIREVTAEISCKDMLATGIGMDICMHALMVPVLVSHLRYFACLTNMYQVLEYKFKDPMLLRFAMTHPSYKLYYGTNPDHVRNSLANCGIRFLQDFSDSKKILAKERKKGINQLYRIMSLMASDDEMPSHVKNYERLEFLGDAVIEFLSSTHLYHLFPELEEGGLTTYRVALVQNQHLSVLAKKLELDKYMLYAHGPDLCRPYELRYAMANCLEAIFGALYLEAGLQHVRTFFGKLLFAEERLQDIWMGHPKHPLQLDFPKTDRHLIETSPVLQKLTAFEESTGIRFRHIRLLARAFTQRSVGYTNLTRGSNQRLEFLGDSVLQLVVSTYLYKHFPDHHEGHLSLLRSSLVNNKNQSIVAQDLGLNEYIIDTQRRMETGGKIPMKIMADLVEALIGAMYVDRGLDIVEKFCSVVFFPRLEDFIMTQDWNDAKSQLQQCCLTLRVEGQEPDVPQYKVISQIGTTNSRQYIIAVYFRNKRMATGASTNIQDAQMEAAKNALRKGNFPHLLFQRKCVMLRKQRDMKMKESQERRNVDNHRSEERDEKRRDNRDDEGNKRKEGRKVNEERIGGKDDGRERSEGRDERKGRRDELDIRNEGRYQRRDDRRDRRTDRWSEQRRDDRYGDRREGRYERRDGRYDRRGNERERTERKDGDGDKKNPDQDARKEKKDTIECGKVSSQDANEFKRVGESERKESEKRKDDGQTVASDMRSLLCNFRENKQEKEEKGKDEVMRREGAPR